MSVILLDSQIVHYEVLGRGRPLIFLHGWVGSWRYWIPVMQAASVSYRAYALDLWGFGDTAKDPQRYTLERQVQLINGFMDHLGMGRVALIGHGLGAVTAVQFALRNPGVVDRVMAVGYPLDESRINPRLRTGLPADLADWLLTKSPLTEPVRTDAPKADPAALQTSFTDMASQEVRQASMMLTNACLLVNGQNDPAVSPPDLDALAGLPEQTHGIIFDQSGHFPMLDESSKFNRLMVDFLALGQGESPRQLQLKEEWKRRVR